MNNKIRVLIVDDQMIVRLGLETILELSNNLIEVVGLAENGEEAVKLVEALKPDIVLMDIRMPVMDGIIATSIIKKKFSQVKVVAMTTFDDDEYVRGALQAGANSYLLKDIPGDQLVNSLLTINKGGTVMSAGIAEKVIQMANSNTTKPIKKVLFPAVSDKPYLSPRELEILQMMAESLTNEEIAKRLYISEGTVRNYVSRIYTRLDARDRTQAVLIAIRMGIIPSSSENHKQ